MESEAGLYALFWRVFFTRTGIHSRVEPEDVLRSKTLYSMTPQAMRAPASPVGSVL
jgi:hypothetical protein